MKNSARLFHCARCHQPVVICQDCDRGHIYCGSVCARAKRRESLCAAGQRYQQSRRGRHQHAQRQRRYRQRQRNKVTHQSSPDLTPNDLLPPSLPAPEKTSSTARVVLGQCHFCGKPVSTFLRLGFLHPWHGHREHSGRWACGP
jgi:hypothetical protein